MHKQSIIRRIIAGKMTKDEAAAELEWRDSSSVDNLLQPDTMKRVLSYQGDVTRMRLRDGHHLQVERALADWIDKTMILFAQTKIGVSMAVIQAKAQKHSDHNFTANTSWFTRFCSRFDFVKIVLSGEAGDVDLTKCKSELEGLRAKLASYKADNIFNLDETGLFYRALPNSLYARSRVIKCKDVRGTKSMLAKDRLTLVLCANATGK